MCEKMIEKVFLRNLNYTLFQVNGPNTHEVFKFLKAKAKPGNPGGFIKCNFTIFIVDRQGIAAERLTTNVTQSSLEEVLVKYI